MEVNCNGRNRPKALSGVPTTGPWDLPPGRMSRNRPKALSGVPTSGLHGGYQQVVLTSQSPEGSKWCSHVADWIQGPDKYSESQSPEGSKWCSHVREAAVTAYVPISRNRPKALSGVPTLTDKPLSRRSRSSRNRPKALSGVPTALPAIFMYPKVSVAIARRL